MEKYYMEKYDGDWHKVINHVRVRRLTLSEEDRVGIGTFQPKDEKNQDSGDLEYFSRPFLISRTMVLLADPTGP